MKDKAKCSASVLKQKVLSKFNFYLSEKLNHGHTELSLAFDYIKDNE